MISHISRGSLTNSIPRKRKNKKMVRENKISNSENISKGQVRNLNPSLAKRSKLIYPDRKKGGEKGDFVYFNC